MARLTDITDARRMVLERARPAGREVVSLEQAAGRVLAQDVVCPDPVPGFDNSAMDGFAIRAADAAGAGPESPATLRLGGESAAGHPASGPVGEGEAVAISTGAMVPEGADAVVRVEDTERDGDRVRILAAPPVGNNIRLAGEDIRPGTRVLGPGAVIGPTELGVIASAGSAEVECARPPRLRFVVTGDELIGAGEPMRPGAIRDSNAHSVPSLAAECGAEVVSVGRAGDDRAETVEALERALEAEVTVVCGGVSVGEHDHVRPALDELGTEEVFWGVSLRPGKPTWFGVGRDGGLVFGLPGNPVSAMVTFILFARPALLAMQGADPAAPRGRARLEEGYEKKPGRAHALRCSLDLEGADLIARVTGPQGSHVLTSMLGADALALIPAESAGVASGEEVEVELMPGSRIGGWPRAPR